jgi:hypothetical protein
LYGHIYGKLFVQLERFNHQMAVAKKGGAQTFGC